MVFIGLLALKMISGYLQGVSGIASLLALPLLGPDLFIFDAFDHSTLIHLSHSGKPDVPLES
jgi:hypothetical protein